MTSTRRHSESARESRSAVSEVLASVEKLHRGVDDISHGTPGGGIAESPFQQEAGEQNRYADRSKAFQPYCIGIAHRKRSAFEGLDLPMELQEHAQHEREDLTLVGRHRGGGRGLRRARKRHPRVERSFCARVRRLPGSGSIGRMRS